MESRNEERDAPTGKGRKKRKNEGVDFNFELLCLGN